MENRLASLLPAEQIRLDLPALDKHGAIGEVAALLAQHPAVRDVAQFKNHLLERESMSSTCVGKGAALPHARTDAVSDIVVAAGRSAAGIEFGAEVVNLIFVIGTPRAMIREYLVVVGELARILKNPANCEAMLRAESPEAFARVLRES